MLFPNKQKYRKCQTARKNAKKLSTKVETRGTRVVFGSFGLKTTTQARITSAQLEAARKATKRYVGKEGKVYTRVFPDRPVTSKSGEVGMGKGKGGPDFFCVEVFPGRVLIEVAGVTSKVAKEALRKGGTKLPVKSKISERI